MVTAIITTAGEQLAPFSNYMLDIAGKPQLERIIEWLIKNNIKDIVITLKSSDKDTVDYFKDGSQYGATIKYVTVDDDASFLDEIFRCKKYVKGDYFLVVKGNVVTNLDLTKAIKTHKIQDPIITMPLVFVKDTSGYVSAESTPLGYVKSIYKNEIKNESGYIDSGIYVIDTNFLTRVDAEEVKKVDFIRHILPFFILNKLVCCYRYSNVYWSRIGSISSYLSICRDFSSSPIDYPKPVLFDDTGRWEGVFGKDFTIYNMRRIADGIINSYYEMLDHFSLIVGFENMSGDKELVEEMARIFYMYGKRPVILQDVVDCDMFAETIKKSKGKFGIGIYIGSNPADQSKYVKILAPDGNAMPPELTKRINYIINNITKVNYSCIK